MRNNEKENIGQWLPFLQTPSTVSTFVPIYFTEVLLFFRPHTADHSINSLSAFFLAGILVTALKCNRFFLWKRVKWPSPKEVENKRSLWFGISSRFWGHTDRKGTDISTHLINICHKNSNDNRQMPGNDYSSLLDYCIHSDVLLDNP